MLRHLAQHLRATRGAGGLTQEQMAERLGFEIRFYQRLEAGNKRDIQLSTIARIASALGGEPWRVLAPVHKIQRKSRS